ncbi:uncharacterized protein F4817DRAFT_312187 [Daldinia loculata]|uniref:uncharacterized protein n=1 Tax=Daldinia loculata TaxID=103429 RepID=UPI0020C44A36|nr:uncharacterized protein F4817DRAFT_312187 [Daldinia loculata]KAI1650829.1 hypothetical protein F4817DRAFT_312187 [Daldinia loculata]
MAIPVIPSHNPINNNVYIQTLMIDYAFSNYKYVMTPEEAEEILAKPYWDDVDAFCSYMIQANFGQPVSSTSNVRLPSAINIYTDEELNAMESGLVELLPPRNAELNTSEESSMENTRPTMGNGQESYVRSISQPVIRIPAGDFENENETGFEGEYLPVYTPEILPPYTPFGIVEILSGEPPVSAEEAREASNTEDVPIYDTIEENHDEIGVQDTSRLDILYTLSSRVDRKFQRVKQKLACSFKTVSPKKALDLTLGIRKGDARKIVGIRRWAFPFTHHNKKPKQSG